MPLDKTPGFCPGNPTLLGSRISQRCFYVAGPEAQSWLCPPPAHNLGHTLKSEILQVRFTDNQQPPQHLLKYHLLEMQFLGPSQKPWGWALQSVLEQAFQVIWLSGSVRTTALGSILLGMVEAGPLPHPAPQLVGEGRAEESMEEPCPAF